MRKELEDALNALLWNKDIDAKTWLENTKQLKSQKTNNKPSRVLPPIEEIYSSNPRKQELIKENVDRPGVEWYEDNSSDNQYGWLPYPDEATAMGY